MLSKQELSEKNSVFWSQFKSYMSNVRSSNGRQMNWLTYPTDIKFIFLRLEADKTSVRICFDIQSKDAGIRAIVWEQMEELKKVLTDAMGESGEWIFNHSNADIASFCRIKWEIKDVNIFVDSDQERIFEFFKVKLIAFDEFYQNFKDILIQLIK